MIWIFISFAVLVIISLIIGFALYKNWIYEQELDNLLWKIDYRDLIITDLEPLKSSLKVSKIYYC